MENQVLNKVVTQPLPCIDRLLNLDASGNATAERLVNPKEQFFIDHFPEFPVLPGVLQLNGMVQTASWWMQWRYNFEYSLVHMTECSPAKFSKLVRPGMNIRFEIQLLKKENEVHAFKGKVLYQDEQVSQARFKLKFYSTGSIDKRFECLETSINAKNRLIFKSLVKDGQLKSE